MINRILIFLTGLLLLVGCKKTGAISDSINSEVIRDVYVCGYEIRPPNLPKYKSIPKYWKNGEAVFLTDANYDEAIATGISVVGNDVYVAGDISVNHNPLYWKNGIPVSVNKGSVLSDPDLLAAITANNQFWKYSAGLPFDVLGTSVYPHVTISAVSVSGKDIYVVGSVDNFSNNVRQPSGISVGAYWKNGNIFLFNDSTSRLSSSLGAIQVIGNDIYVVGSFYINNGGYNGAYWKNDIRYPLFSEANTIDGISVVGNDVYVAGTGKALSSGAYGPKYWKNGVPADLGPYVDFQTQKTTGLFVKDNNVYVSGSGYNYLPNTIVFNVAKSWKDGMVQLLSNEKSTWDFTTGIFVK